MWAAAHPAQRSATTGLVYSAHVHSAPVPTSATHTRSSIDPTDPNVVTRGDEGPFWCETCQVRLSGAGTGVKMCGGKDYEKRERDHTLALHTKPSSVIL